MKDVAIRNVASHKCAEAVGRAFNGLSNAIGGSDPERDYLPSFHIELHSAMEAKSSFDSEAHLRNALRLVRAKQRVEVATFIMKAVQDRVNKT